MRRGGAGLRQPRPRGATQRGGAGERGGGAGGVGRGGNGGKGGGGGPASIPVLKHRELNGV